MIRSACVESIGLMDESLFMYCEETDWCLRLRKANWEVWVEPSAEIVHLGGQSSMQADARTSAQLRESKVAYMKKHHSVLSGAILGLALNARLVAKSLAYAIPRKLNGHNGSVGKL